MSRDMHLWLFYFIFPAPPNSSASRGIRDILWRPSASTIGGASTRCVFSFGDQFFPRGSVIDSQSQIHSFPT